MGDVTKWVILAAVAVTVISLLVSLPIMVGIDLEVYAAGIDTIVSIAGDALLFGRGLINNLLSDWARDMLSGLMIYLVAKWLCTYSIRVYTWVHHYLFK